MKQANPSKQKLTAPFFQIDGVNVILETNVLPKEWFQYTPIYKAPRYDPEAQKVFYEWKNAITSHGGMKEMTNTKDN